MNKMVLLMLISAMLAGCNGGLFVPAINRYGDCRDDIFVVLKKDEAKLDGPYKIIDRVASNRMIVRRNGAEYELFLRGCRGLGGEYDNIVTGSFLMDRGVYLLKNTVRELSSNQIAAVVYRPANRVYVGMPKGFENLTYIMPQVVHIANGELLADHSDTNYPLYRVFAEAERMAKRNREGYWATHKEPPAGMPP